MAVKSKLSRAEQTSLAPLREVTTDIEGISAKALPPNPVSRPVGPKPAEAARFEVVRGGPSVIKLVCKTGGTLGPAVRAHLAGRIIGEVATNQGIARSGETIDIPIEYLPYHALPLQVQFTSASPDDAIAAAFVIGTEQEASELVGMGLLTVSDLRVEQARIFGVVSNAINGISRPVLYARFNGFVVRPLDVEEPQQHDRGGMSARFSGAIRAEDLSDLGLVIDICAVGVAAPIGSLGFSRLEPRALEERLIRMELEIGHLRRSMAIEASTLLTNIERRQMRNFHRTEEAIQYLTSIVFDRIASQPSVAPTGPVPSVLGSGPDLATLPTATPAAMPAELMALWRSPLPEVIDNRLVVDADSDLFVSGWYDVEDQGGVYRWMGAAGIVANPYPDRPILSVEVSLRMHFGSVFPALSAQVGSRRTVAQMFEVNGERRVQFSLPPGEGETEKTGHLRVMSSNVGRPIELDPLSEDLRELSVAVSRVVYCYAPEAIQDIPNGG